MAKKRAIFTLLFSDGYFMLSRNFRLQKAGDVRWLLKHYNFSAVASSLDELIILDVSRERSSTAPFLKAVEQVIDQCFIPVALGGGIDRFSTAREYVTAGADKLIVNSAFDNDPTLCRRIADFFGSQCLVGSVDVRRGPAGDFEVVSRHNSVGATPRARIGMMLEAGAGEILLQSVDRDGTGFGFDFDSLDLLQERLPVPLILCGGCGRSEHMHRALSRPDVDAVATANLFNFIGDGFPKARVELLAEGFDLAQWDVARVEALRGAASALQDVGSAVA